MFSIKVTQDLKRDMERETLKAQKATTRAIRLAGSRLQGSWRQAIRGAGLGNRLANTVRLKVYPETKPSLNAAALIWTKAPKIVDAFDKGVLIRSRSGFWLAIPLPHVRLKGRNNRKITPLEWEERTGRRLRFVYRPGRAGLLVDDGTYRDRKTADPMSFSLRRKVGRRNLTIPIFVLVRQAKLPKRLNLDPLTQLAIQQVPGLIVTGWRED